MPITRSEIYTEKLTVGYEKKIVVKDITISAHPGRILTLIGPNGSGKSTILKSITGHLKLLGGMVYLDKTSIKDMSEMLIARRLSMVMTDRIRPELMSCREVAATGRYPHTGRLGILSAQDWEKVDLAMELVHASEVSDKDFLKISDGQKQRVMLARAVCQETKIMVLDEPTSYLDMRYKLDIMTNIRKLAREKNIAIVMSLHELDLAREISDTIVCVDSDRIDRTGSTEDIFSGNYLQKLYKIPDSCFDPLLGSLYLPGNMNTPNIFVIGGGGAAISSYQQLQKFDIPFAAGILSENDLEYPMARATASRIISTKPFSPIEDEHITRAKKMIDECESCICALSSFGEYNQANQVLRDYAKKTGKLISQLHFFERGETEK